MTLNYGSPAFPTLLPRGHPTCSRPTTVAVSLSGSSLEACPHSVVAVPLLLQELQAPPHQGSTGVWR